MKESRQLGIKGGSPIELYPEEALNPLMEAERLLRAGVTGNETARRLGRSSSWVRKQKARIELLLMNGGDKKLKEWMDAMNRIREMEIERGRGIARKGFKTNVSTKMAAVRRMTSGYENEPLVFPAPTPEMLEDYFINFNLYKPKRGK